MNKSMTATAEAACPSSGFWHLSLRRVARRLLDRPRQGFGDRFPAMGKVPVQHSCCECSKTFSRKGDLTRHEKIHQNIKPHICGICSKPFAQFSGLKTHMNTHNNEKPHHCSFCGIQFADPSSCTRHEKERHRCTHPYQCPYCTSRIKRRSVFALHLRTKHGIDTDTFDISACAPPLLPTPLGKQRKKPRKGPSITVDTGFQVYRDGVTDYDNDLSSASSSGSSSPTDLLPSPIDGADLPNGFQLPPYPNACFGREVWAADQNADLRTFGQQTHSMSLPLAHPGDVKIMSPDGNSALELSGGYYHLTTREIAFSQPNYWPYEQGIVELSEFSFLDPSKMVY